MLALRAQCVICLLAMFLWPLCDALAIQRPWHAECGSWQSPNLVGSDACSSDWGHNPSCIDGGAQCPCHLKGRMCTTQFADHDLGELDRVHLFASSFLATAHIDGVGRWFANGGCSHRAGEATNPGPVVSIRSFNPTQLLHCEEMISQWPDGAWLGCETSHTVAAQAESIRRFRRYDVHAKFSQAVPKHTQNAGMMRGKASGNVLLSRFPIRSFPVPLNEDLSATCRLVDGIVQFGEGSEIYVSAVYGPPVCNQIFANGEGMFQALMEATIDRASRFHGPALITGDFNRELAEVPQWKKLQKLG